MTRESFMARSEPFPERTSVSWRSLGGFVLGIAGGCMTPKDLPAPRHPDVSPGFQEHGSNAIDVPSSPIPPMYTEVMAIDLGSVVQLARANNIDIQDARNRVEMRKGGVEQSVGSAFPVLSPVALFEQVDGSVRATEGNLVDVDFRTSQAYALVQWIVNPGKVYYDILAARKRLLASQYAQRAVVLETMHSAAREYFELVLTQQGVATAHQVSLESDEFLRLAQSRVGSGTGLAADEMIARAEVAGRSQDLVLAINAFYQASVALARTLDLDPTVTLVPQEIRIEPITLVRDGLSIEELLDLALEHRDDLKSARELLAAARAERKAASWNAFGPTIQGGYQTGGISGSADHVNGGPDQNFDEHSQERLSAGVSWRLTLASLGEQASARAGRDSAVLAVERRMAAVRAEVVSAHVEGKARFELIDRAYEQLIPAQEAVRLARAGFSAGTLTALEVLHAQSVVAQACDRQAAAVIGYNRAQVDLLAALGLLDESSLAAGRAPFVASSERKD